MLLSLLSSIGSITRSVVMHTVALRLDWDYRGRQVHGESPILGYPRVHAHQGKVVMDSITLLLTAARLVNVVQPCTQLVKMMMIYRA